MAPLVRWRKMEFPSRHCPRTARCPSMIFSIQSLILIKRQKHSSQPSKQLLLAGLAGNERHCGEFGRRQVSCRSYISRETRCYRDVAEGIGKAGRATKVSHFGDVGWAACAIQLEPDKPSAGNVQRRNRDPLPVQATVARYQPHTTLIASSHSPRLVRGRARTAANAASVPSTLSADDAHPFLSR
jgi:hypothetical protein